jgi:hypothetical protein
MSHVGVIVEAIVVVARPGFRGKGYEDPRLVELRIASKGRRFTLPQVGEYKAQIFLCWVRSNPDLLGVGRILARLFHTLAGTIVFPTVVTATDTVALHPTGGELGPSMGASKGH